jgi:hypothetical protein
MGGRKKIEKKSNVDFLILFRRKAVGTKYFLLN